MTDTVKAWIEERRAIIHGAREAIRPAEAIDLGLIDLPRALNALEAVLELHKPVERRKWWAGRWEKKTVCEECTSMVNEIAEWEHEETYVEYPCATVRTIEGAINE